MTIPDVNIFIYAHREECEHHARYAEWITNMATGVEPFGISESALQGFVRIVTNPRIFNPPSTLAQTFQFIDALLSRPNCVVIRPGANHWRIYRQLCLDGSLNYKLTVDAAHAALAIEYGCEWVSADTDFARFTPQLRWQRL